MQQSIVYIQVQQILRRLKEGISSTLAIVIVPGKTPVDVAREKHCHNGGIYIHVAARDPSEGGGGGGGMGFFGGGV